MTFFTENESSVFSYSAHKGLILMSADVKLTNVNIPKHNQNNFCAASAHYVSS